MLSDNIHRDVLILLGASLKQFCHFDTRYESIKSLIVDVVGLLNLLYEKKGEDVLDLGMEPVYNQFYEAKFTKKTNGPCSLEKELQTVVFGFTVLIKYLVPSQMIDILSELMNAKQMVPLAIYCVTCMQHVI